MLSIEVDHSDGMKIDAFMKNNGYRLVQKDYNLGILQNKIYVKI